jgi:DNA (cytosine-5)-methyltransferase 1
MKAIAIDIFSGIGGLTEGLKQAGFNVLGAVEIDPIVSKAYKMNHRSTYLWNKPVQKLSSKEILQKLNLKKGELSLLAGCPPCQGFSSLRTKNSSSSVEDERNDLVFEMVRLAEELLPKSILIENVPGLAKDPRMKDILSRLKELGYYVDDETVQLHDISAYGVPQRRKRMILMTSLGKKIPFASKVLNKVTVKDTIKKMHPPGNGNDPLHDYPVKRTEKVQKMISLIPKNGGSRKDLPKEYWLPCHLKYPNGFRDVYGRMKWDDVAPTITGGCINPSKGRFLHPEEDRAITLREASLLQSFPEDYKFPTDIARDKIALMIGNALPPTYIKKQAEQIKKTILHLR